MRCAGVRSQASLGIGDHGGPVQRPFLPEKASLKRGKRVSQALQEERAKAERARASSTTYKTSRRKHPQVNHKVGQAVE